MSSVNSSGESIFITPVSSSGAKGHSFQVTGLATNQQASLFTKYNKQGEGPVASLQGKVVVLNFPTAELADQAKAELEREYVPDQEFDLVDREESQLDASAETTAVWDAFIGVIDKPEDNETAVYQQIKDHLTKLLTKPLSHESRNALVEFQTQLTLALQGGVIQLGARDKTRLFGLFVKCVHDLQKKGIISNQNCPLLIDGKVGKAKEIVEQKYVPGKFLEKSLLTPVLHLLEEVSNEADMSARNQHFLNVKETLRIAQENLGKSWEKLRTAYPNALATSLNRSDLTQAAPIGPGGIIILRKNQDETMVKNVTGTLLPPAADRSDTDKVIFCVASCPHIYDPFLNRVCACLPESCTRKSPTEDVRMLQRRSFQEDDSDQEQEMQGQATPDAPINCRKVVVTPLQDEGWFIEDGLQWEVRSSETQNGIVLAGSFVCKYRVKKQQDGHFVIEGPTRDSYTRFRGMNQSPHPKHNEVIAKCVQALWEESAKEAAPIPST